MAILVLDPQGEVAKPKVKAQAAIESLNGRKVGFVFNQHGAAADFWKALEEGISQLYKPSEIQRIYKDNTWAPAPLALVDKMSREVDYALVGVGA